ncbi:MAG TPA: FHA domain-containing protein [Anaerolineae bacterium]|nr:FHA domain-containing protein [Anaerolineae bacterium]
MVSGGGYNVIMDVSWQLSWELDGVEYTYDVLGGDGTKLVVGRSVDCDLRIEDGTVSRRQAELIVGDELKLLNLQEKNPVWVNKRPLRKLQMITLRVGDRLQLGQVGVQVGEDLADAGDEGARQCAGCERLVGERHDYCPWCGRLV